MTFIKGERHFEYFAPSYFTLELESGKRYMRFLSNKRRRLQSLARFVIGCIGPGCMAVAYSGFAAEVSAPFHIRVLVTLWL